MHSTFKRDIVDSNPALVETIFRPLVHLVQTRRGIKWTGRRLVTDSSTKSACVIHESKAVQMHAQSPLHPCASGAW